MSEHELEAGRTWPLTALLLPLASASLLLWWVSAEGRALRSGGEEPPVVVRPPIDVPGWFASRALPGGGTLTARVTPLHAEPSEQAFDAAALARRLAAGEGEAWRCELTYSGDGTSGDGASGDGTSGDGASGDGTSGDGTVPPLALDRLVLEDRTGPVCAPLEPGPHGPPVAWMFTVPRVPLQPGEGVEVWLWGRQPGAGARLRFGPDQTLALAPRTIAERELLRGLASLAPGGGPSIPKGIR